MKKLPAVTAYTPEGKILVAILRGLLGGVHLIMGKKWAIPPPFFHDDPRHYTTRDLIYFAYKYYFKPPRRDAIHSVSRRTEHQINAENVAQNIENAENVAQNIENAENVAQNIENAENVAQNIENAENVERVRHRDAMNRVSTDSKTFFKDYPPIFPIENHESARTLTLTAAGDLMPYEWIQPKFCTHLWDDIGDDFFSSDITFANLETPIDTLKPPSLVPEVMLSNMLFNGDETMFSIFNGTHFTPKTAKRVGFDILSTANNHSLDMGEEGVYETIEFLKNKNIQHVGTAFSPEERAKTTIIERNGIRLAFISYTFSMNQKVNPPDKPWLVNHLEVNQPDVDLSVLTKDIAKAKEENADLVILSLHYGNAYQAYPCPHIVDNTKRIFEECGVDIILGGHPHNIQPMAVYPFTCPHTGVEKRGFVLFSFGDFVAYDIFNWCHLPVYLKLEIGLFNGDSLSVTENPTSDPSLRSTKQPNQNVIARHDFNREARSGTEGGQKRTILTKAEAVPVYVCGNYRSRNDRELRFLDARKTLALIDADKIPPFMTAWNVRELRGLMQFYNDFFVTT